MANDYYVEDNILDEACNKGGIYYRNDAHIKDVLGFLLDFGLHIIITVLNIVVGSTHERREGGDKVGRDEGRENMID